MLGPHAREYPGRGHNLQDFGCFPPVLSHIKEEISALLSSCLVLLQPISLYLLHALHTGNLLIVEKLDSLCNRYHLVVTAVIRTLAKSKTVEKKEPQRRRREQ